jgi:mannose-6-phosphate isomerase-like protein (cupin superfamily)
MTYLGEGGEVTALFRPTGDVEPLRLGTGTTARFVAPGWLTKGQFGLFRWDIEPRAGGAAPHFHRDFSESFYVLSGTVALYDGESWVRAGEGDFLYVPEGGVHGFKNDGDEPASMLILFAPGKARERFFEELADIAESGRQLSQDEWTELYARHDQFMV